MLENFICDLHQQAMANNLETADILVKLVLATVVIILFTAEIIAGPVAILLVIVSSVTLTLYAARYILKRHGGKEEGL